jgi:PAS domain S-box-containing protein
MKKRKPIFFYMVWLAVTTSAPLIFLAGYGVYQTEKIARDDAINSTEAASRLAAQRVRGFLQDSKAILVAMGNMDVVQDNNIPAIQRRLKAFRSLHPELANVILFDNSDKVVGSGLTLPTDFDTAFARRIPGYRQALEQPPFVLTEPFLSPISNTWVVATSYPVFHGGERIGTLLATIDLSETSKRLLFAEGATFTIVNVLTKTGKVALRSHDAEKFVGRSAADSVALTSGASDASTEGQAAIDVTDRRYSASNQIPGSDWIVVASNTSVEALTRARATSRGIAALSFATLVASALCVFIFARKLSAPITQLAASAKEYREGTPIQSPAGGTSETNELIIALNEMMSERERRILEAHHSAEQVRVIFETAPLAILTTSTTGRIETINPAGVRLLQQSSNDLIGQTNLDQFIKLDEMSPPAPHDKTDIRSAFNVLVSKADSGIESDAEWTCIRKDGSTVPISLSISPQFGADRTLYGYTAIASDNTFRKEAEAERTNIARRVQESQRLESLGLMAGGIAHDFNNLLTGIIGNLDLARMDTPDRSPARKSLEASTNGARRAAELCKQMLVYSGRGRLESQECDINVLTSETAALLNISAKNVHLHFELCTEPALVVCDKTKICQVIMNLVINSAEAMNGRRGNIHIVTRHVRADEMNPIGSANPLPRGPYVEFTVVDDGCGMTPATKAKIFDPFFTTKETGTGLGLSAVVGIIRAHGGAITIESEVGAGTKFTIHLPKAPRPTSPRTYIIRNATTPTTSQFALVVDDDPAVREIAATLLSRNGMMVERAADGVEALQMCSARKGGYAVILLDLTMPKMGGAEALEEMRQSGVTAPVILMSGFDRTQAMNRIARDSYTLFLQKPFSNETMMAGVTSAVSC